MGGWLFLAPSGFAGSLRGAVACAPSDYGLLAPNDSSSMEKAWSLALWGMLVCYNTGYRVGKLTGLPSRRKGIMSMARYHYTRENENGVVLYLESEPAEDAMDEFDDEIAVGFSGNGYLRFWTRCRRAAEALPNGLKYAAGGRCVITDTFTGEEKIWRVGL